MAGAYDGEHVRRAAGLLRRPRPPRAPTWPSRATGRPGRRGPVAGRGTLARRVGLTARLPRPRPGRPRRDPRRRPLLHGARREHRRRARVERGRSPSRPRRPVSATEGGSPERMMAAVTDSMAERTGRDLDAWVALVEASGVDPLDQKAVRAWL